MPTVSAVPAPRRSTRQRRLVYEAVVATRTHPTAERVYASVRRSAPRISLGTVYRNLQVLVEDGRLRSFAREGRLRYDGDVSPHDHFACDRCGLLLDVPPAADVRLAERRLRAKGIAVLGRTLEYHGLCRSCRHGLTLGGEKTWPSSPARRLTKT